MSARHFTSAQHTNPWESDSERESSGRERGHWVEQPLDDRPTDSVAPLAWMPRLSLWARVSRGLSAPTIIGFAVFAVVVVITGGIMLSGLRDQTDVAPDLGVPALVSPIRDADGAAAGVGPGVADGTPVAEEALFVHVVGEVNNPGVVEVTAGTRVRDAIEAAGGATDDAVLAALNLARTLVDGEQIVVPDAKSAESMLASGGAVSSQAGQPGAGSAGDAVSLVNINTATSEQLQMLPSIGPATAQRIIAWREANGPFVAIDQLLEVSGIGPKTFEGLRDLVAV